jgi:hypothetical protein
MTRAWHVQRDGTYRQLGEIEDLFTEMISTLEDAHETYRLVLEISTASRAIGRQSRLLIEQSQRDRRLRNTTLRLVPALA